MKPSSELEAAQRLETAGLWDAAEAVYVGLLNANQSWHAAWHAFGMLALRTGNLGLAARRIENAIDLDGKVALYHRTIAEIYCRMGLLDKALSAGRRAAKLAPKDALNHRTIGTIYSAKNENTKAIESFNAAAKLNSRDDITWNNLGCVLMAQGRKAEAEKAIAKAIACNPSHADAQNNLGLIRVEQGRLDDARICFEAAVSAQPEFAVAHYHLSMTRKYKANDPYLATLEKMWPRRHILSDEDKVACCFALGKAWEDTGQYERSFAAYEEGNRCQHQLQPFDEGKMDTLVARIIEVFNKNFFEERNGWRGASNDQRTPVFIVGMPRSGTSLLEQILSAHPTLHGAGELKDMDEIIAAATGESVNKPYTDGVVTLSEDDLIGIGKDYLDRVTSVRLIS
jgi:tetratricopeptide (TPR) repeat protein